MPITSSPALRASIVTDEMTLLMPGAGPPPTRIAQRGRVRDVPLVRDAATLVILGSLPISGVSGSLTHRKLVPSASRLLLRSHQSFLLSLRAIAELWAQHR